MLPRPKALRSPAWRLDSCLKNLEAEVSSGAECDYTRQLQDFLAGGGGYTFNPQLEEAYLLYYLPQSRAILSSLILAGTDIATIAEYIESTEDTVLYFSKLFFDISVFPNRLVTKEFVDSLPENTSVESNCKALMRSALSLGGRYIAWKMSLNIPQALSSPEIHSNILEDAYWRAREHKPFPLDGAKARDSRAWVPQVLRIMDSLNSQQTGGELTIETLRLKLVNNNNTKSLSDLSSEVRG
jgi:hypothetical protein